MGAARADHDRQRRQADGSAADARSSSTVPSARCSTSCCDPRAATSRRSDRRCSRSASQFDRVMILPVSHGPVGRGAPPPPQFGQGAATRCRRCSCRHRSPTRTNRWHPNVPTQAADGHAAGPAVPEHAAQNGQPGQQPPVMTSPRPGMLPAPPGGQGQGQGESPYGRSRRTSGRRVPGIGNLDRRVHHRHGRCRENHHDHDGAVLRSCAGGEYAARGDYHRTPDPDWDYYPTYIAKLEAVRRWLEPPRRPDTRARRRLWRRRARRGVRRTTRDRRHRRELSARPRAQRFAHRAAVSPRAHSIARCALTSSSTSRSKNSPGRSRSCFACCAGRRAARLGAEPRAPPVAGAFRAARPADPHRIRGQASGRPSGRRVPSRSRNGLGSS